MIQFNPIAQCETIRISNQRKYLLAGGSGNNAAQTSSNTGKVDLSILHPTLSENQEDMEMVTSPESSGIIASGSCDNGAQTISSLSENRQDVEMVTSLDDSGIVAGNLFLIYFCKVIKKTDEGTQKKEMIMFLAVFAIEAM